jgi:hypothetical protein
MKEDVKRKNSPSDLASPFLGVPAPCEDASRWVVLTHLGCPPAGSVMTSGSCETTQAAKGPWKREPWFYLRLEAYSFLGFFEGA